MLFNDDDMLNFGGKGFGDDVLDSLFGGAVGFDPGEVIITGRVPGALYVSDFSDANSVLEHVLPLEFSPNLIVDAGGDLGISTGADLDPTGDAAEDDGGDAGAALVAANDDDAPAALTLPSHGKDAEPLVLIQGDDDAAQAVVPLDLVTLHDLDIPPLPGQVDLSMVTVTPPNSADADPVILGGPAYQSLSFLILDTPFVVGDDHLPPTVRPSLEELLGLAGDDTWVLPLGANGAWRLG